MENCEINPASDHSVLVVFGDVICDEHHRRVVRLMTALTRAAYAFVRNLHPAYSSLLVSYEPCAIGPQDLHDLLRQHLEHLDEVPIDPPTTVEIPVRYGGAHGPDLADVARLHGLSVDEVVNLHSSAEYRVYFLGFSPGFAYLGGLPPQLETPRLATPRTTIPAGSVAIAGRQAGVYPLASPGGWRILGRTPLRLFTPEQADPTLLHIGDRVRFRPIE